MRAEDHEGVIDADNEFPSTIAAVEPCRPGACRSALPAEAAGPVRELLRLFALLGRHKGPAGEEEAGLCIELREGAYAEFTMFVPSRKAPFEAEFLGLRAIPDPAELHEGADVLLAFVEQGQAMWPQLETEEQFARRLVGISHGPWEVGLLQTIARPCLGYGRAEPRICSARGLGEARGYMEGPAACLEGRGSASGPAITPAGSTCRPPCCRCTRCRDQRSGRRRPGAAVCWRS